MKQHIKAQNRLRRARARFTASLNKFDPHHLFRLIWAIRGTQSQPSAAHLREFVDLPKEAIGADITSPYRAHPWQLETIANEYLAAHVETRVTDAPISTRRFRWSDLAELVNALQNLEESESLVFGALDDVFREIVRIKYRQFPWQTGIIVYPALFRSHFLLCPDEIRSRFEARNEISLDAFVRCGFGFWAQSLQSPASYITADFKQIGITLEQKKHVLGIMGRDWRQASEAAASGRNEDAETAYKYSVFRRHPLMVLPGKPSRVYAPFTDLLFNRIAGELYYDCVVGSDECQNAYAGRFEQYCFELLTRTLPEADWQQEFQYGSKKRLMKSPDIIGVGKSSATLIVECKAKRAPFSLKFDIREQDRLDSHIHELAKGQFQIWRFAHDVRTGASGGEGGVHTLADACGLVVTYEDWSTALPKFRETIDAVVKELAEKKGVELTDQDRIPTCFIGIETLEQLAVSASLSTLREAIAAYRNRFEGWDLFNVWQKLNPDILRDRRYPFKGDLAQVLPWLDEIWKGASDKSRQAG